MRFASSHLAFAILGGALAFEALKEQKVMLDSIEDGKVYTLTFYSVHVPEWLGSDSAKDAKNTPGVPTDSSVERQGVYKYMDPIWEKLAKDAKIPVGKIDPSKGPMDFQATFPSGYLNKAQVRFTSDNNRLKISCKAANEDTMVSYRVPKDTSAGDISHLLVPKKVSAFTLRGSQEKTFTVVDMRPESPLADAWMGMQDFCIMLLEMREMFMRTLRDQVVDRIDNAKLMDITRASAADLSTGTSASLEPASSTSPTTTIRIFNIGNGPSNSKLSAELEQVVKKGRCLGTSFSVNAKVLASQEPVIGLVDVSNPVYTKLRCFSFFEGNIIPVVEITEPRDAAQCNENTESGGKDKKGWLTGLKESVVGFINQMAGAAPPDKVPFKMFTGSLSGSAATTDTAASPTLPDNVTKDKVQNLCRRLTEDYLVAVQDDDITCDDGIFKYTKGLKVSEKTGEIASGGTDHNDLENSNSMPSATTDAIPAHADEHPIEQDMGA